MESQDKKEKNEIESNVKKTLMHTMWVSVLVSLSFIAGYIRSCDIGRIDKKTKQIQQDIYLQRAIQEGIAREIDIDTNGTIDYIAGDRIFLRSSQDSVEYTGYKIKDYRKKISIEIKELERKIDGLYEKGKPNATRQGKINELEKKKENLQNGLYKLETLVEKK